MRKISQKYWKGKDKIYYLDFNDGLHSKYLKMYQIIATSATPHMRIYQGHSIQSFHTKIF